MKTEKMTNDKAKKAIAAIKEIKGIKEIVKSSYDVRLSVFNLYRDVDTVYLKFCDDTQTKKESGYKQYFEPILVKQFPKFRWSFSQIKKFRRYDERPELKKAYLNDEVIKGEGSNRTVTQKFKSALSSINNLLKLPELKGYTLKLTNGIYEIIEPAKNKEPMKRFTNIKKEGPMGKDLTPLESGLQQ